MRADSDFKSGTENVHERLQNDVTVETFVTRALQAEEDLSGVISELRSLLLAHQLRSPLHV